MGAEMCVNASLMGRDGASSKHSFLYGSLK